MKKTEQLPNGLKRPTPNDPVQGCLFHKPFASVLADLRVSIDELARWHAKGWLSFDGTGISEVDEFDDARTWELTVVRDVVRSGLTDAQVEHWLAQLPKPCAVNPSRVAYSFRYGWVECVEPDDPDTVVAEHVDGWLDSCEDDDLEALRVRIDELIAQRAQERAEESK